MRVVREVHEVAALDRLHDDDGLAEFAADLVASAALHGGIVVVGVVELDLHDLNLRIVRQDLLEHLRPVVKRDADVAHLALGLEGEGRLIGVTCLEVRIVARALRVHEIEVEILDAAGGQLALEKRADVLLGLEEGGGQLVRQDIALARVAARQTLAQGAGKSIPFSGRLYKKN